MELGQITTYREWNELLAQQQTEKMKTLAAQDANDAHKQAEFIHERSNLSLFEPSCKLGPFHGESLKVIVKVRFSGTSHFSVRI